jgi:growth factor-regulated tyrosine kinase substrate
VEIASREFIDNLVSIARAFSGTNPGVKQKILAILQTWALAFKGKPELSYVVEVYNGLKREGKKLYADRFLLNSWLIVFLGIHFPPVEKSEASSIMVDTTTVGLGAYFLIACREC